MPAAENLHISGREQMQQHGAGAVYSITSSARASSVGGMVRPERLGGLQIDDEIEFGRLLDRKIDRLRPRRILSTSSAARRCKIREVDAIGDQPSINLATRERQ